MIPWEIEADELVSCNCAYGCPCQFNALPTYGDCQALAGFQIKRGHFGDTQLDGLRAVAVMQWPGPIHEGSGKAFIIVDQRADEQQRQALLSILSGAETDMGATIWNVFAATFEEVFEPAFETIDIAIDVDGRHGHVTVEGLAQSVGRPILNPVSGEEHRARISLPEGFEYTLAEIGSSTFSASGPIQMSFEDRYAQFAHLHLNNHGVVNREAA
jgi:hypothetical protein